MSGNYHEECEEIIEKWSKFRRGLRGDERDKFDDMMDKARKHKTAGDEQDNPKAIETFLFSILVEQQMKIDRLERELDDRGKDVDKY